MICPNCKSDATWLEEDAARVWLRCHCGLMLLVKQVNGGIVIQTRVGGQARLPTKGTKLFEVLMVVASFETVRTDEVALRVNRKTCFVATSLNTLDTYGLVTAVESRRGKRSEEHTSELQSH